jgi:hypothetical protein
MKAVTVEITGTSTLAQGKYVTEEKKDKELAGDYEVRTWRYKMHYDKDGNVFIPLYALKNCISEAAKFLAIKIPGKGNATYTKHFEAGVTVADNMFIGVKKDAVECQQMFVPSDGVRGSNKRVIKYFPVIPEWRGTVKFLILDDTITEDVFKLHIEQAGQFIGLGSFRPRNNGYFGRFKIKIKKWEDTLS